MEHSLLAREDGALLQAFYMQFAATPAINSSQKTFNLAIHTYASIENPASREQLLQTTAARPLHLAQVLRMAIG